MWHWKHALSIAPLLAAVLGCRHADLNRELVERELRLQEDELYRAHDEIADRERRLESIRSENAALKRELEQSRAGAPLPPGIEPVMPPAPTGEPPRRSGRTNGGPPIDLSPPTIELPDGGGPPSEAPPRDGAVRGSSWRESRGVRQASFEKEASEYEGQTRRSTDDRVAKIVLNRRLTGGYNADRQLGDDGVMVFIEPRSSEDRLVHRAGDVSIALVDPALSGPKGRVARWDFTAAESKRLFRKTALGEGMKLDLLWPGEPPQNERLIVFARFSVDGETFEANEPILVDLGRSEDPAGAEDDTATTWSPDR